MMKGMEVREAIIIGNPKAGRNRGNDHLKRCAEILRSGALDVEIWPTSLVVPAGYRIALSVRGRDYEHPQASGEKLTTFRNELRGSGPFLHDDPRDRPHDVFGGSVTVHTGGENRSYLLLPFVPEA